MDSTRGRLDQVKVSVLVFVSLAGVVCGMTLLFLGMRAVMEIGGSCAEGGPYVSARPCPDGVPLAMFGGIFGGVGCLFVYIWQTWSRGIAGFTLLAWPALFLSLGWNFLEFGLDPPGAGGLAWGWLVCAVTFAAMGGVPLVLGARWIVPSILPVGREPGSPARSAGGLSRWSATRPASSLAPTGPARPDLPSTATAETDDVVDALERLAALRAAGALSEEEFAAAKRRLLETGP